MVQGSGNPKACLRNRRNSFLALLAPFAVRPTIMALAAPSVRGVVPPVGALPSLPLFCGFRSPIWTCSSFCGSGLGRRLCLRQSRCPTTSWHRTNIWWRHIGNWQRPWNVVPRKVVCQPRLSTRFPAFVRSWRRIHGHHRSLGICCAASPRWSHQMPHSECGWCRRIFTRA